MSGFTVCNRIREFRRQRAQPTRADLAQACGVTRQTFIALEAEKCSPSLELAFKLARTLERKLEEVFRCEEKK